MNQQAHEQLKSTIWEIANRLRGPYRPPQYRLVMLPIVVLRRLDCVLEPTKDAVLKEYERLMAQEVPESAMERILGRAADPTRKHPLYNTSPYIIKRLSRTQARSVTTTRHRMRVRPPRAPQGAP